MPKHVMLNNIAHKDLRVIRRFGAQFGDNVPTVLTFPTEFADVQREYPIFFRKDPATNEYQSVALLGFEKNENLFLEGDMWRANYIPGVVARGPFLIGFQDQEIDGEIRKEPVIHVDMEHPRVSRTEGEPVFLPQGGNSPYLDYIANVLRGIRDGFDVSKDMFAAILEFDLIEPVNVEIKLNENEAYSLVGLQTINQTKLASLDGAALEKLNRAGFLQGAFLVAASLSNVQRLMAIKQRKRHSA
ncbi:MAG TPA: SapC family protein [Steroidobacteraceae bacterium]|nr:SapC family protein [Steroidobacteraceae bacterium]